MIFQAEFIAALAMGFFGSLHCLGMCGPIALVCPSAFPGTLGRLVGTFFYNSGRVMTYAVLGALMGSVGKGVSIMQYQQALSIGLGIVIILLAIMPGLKNIRIFEKVGLRFTNNVKKWMGSFLKKTSITGILSIGLVNGLLPCGLVYMGLAGSLDMGSIEEGALFMAYFGLGTFPMMAGLHLMGNSFRTEWRQKLTRIIPVFIFIMGVLFILRGLGLGIPYVSPSTDPHTGDIHCTMPAHRHQ